MTNQSRENDSGTRPICVLLVDDEILVRWSVSEALTKAGCDVAVAESAEAACASLERQKFDIVITDLKLPEADGLEVARCSRRLQPTTTVILMGSNVDEDIKDRAREAGIFEFLDKPVTLSTIIWSVVRLARSAPPRSAPSGIG